MGKDQNIEAYSRMISVGLLAAGVAHEISNPTAFVKSNTAYLLRNIQTLKSAENLTEEQSDILMEVLDILQENADGMARIERLVRELKAYSRPSEVIGPVSLEKVLESAIVLTWNRLKYKAKVSRDFDSSISVRADYGKIEEVAINLLNNAADAISSKGKIELRVYKKGRFGCFDVKDNGSGIPPDKQKKVFDAFYTTKGDSGTGLGLYLCQKIVSASGGTMEMQSTPGQGTCFSICIPLPDPNAE